MTTAIICSAILAAMLFLLGFNVSRMRGVTAKAGGSQMPTDPASPLLLAIRAHGNAAEYVPTLIVLILVCATLSGGWWVQALAMAAVVARYLHAFGMLTSKTLASHGPVRDIGALGTYVTGVALGITAIVAVA